MTLYLLFLTMATLTVLSPGPGVVMTLSNALRFGLRGTLGGIFGIAVGALVVAAISATSLGVLLATSALAFTIAKLLGAAYLLYLGVRLWFSPPFRFEAQSAHEARFARRFVEGLTLQLTNPKAVFFFLSIFPQFIIPSESYIPQFARLVLTYSTLVVAIHCSYALLAKQARAWLTSERGGRVVNRTAASTFVFFSAVLASAHR
jgi:threonine/homoserine/homoserine lactone efflux protein